MNDVRERCLFILLTIFFCVATSAAFANEPPVAEDVSRTFTWVSYKQLIMVFCWSDSDGGSSTPTYTVVSPPHIGQTGSQGRFSQLG